MSVKPKKEYKENGAVLLSVILLSILIVTIIAGSYLLLMEPENLYKADLNQTQSYYNAEAGILEGEYQISKMTSPPSSPQTYKQTSWSDTVSKISQTNTNPIIYTFQIQSTGTSNLYEKNTSTSLSVNESVSLN